jgi:two-component system KDP operon response regulator KdpE
MQQQVLVIDDEPDVRTLLQLALSKRDYTVLSAPNAISGIHLAFRHHPDAIILDVKLPDMDGFEACRRLREITDTPILLLTGYLTSPEDIVKGLSLGADEYMSKPFDTAELIGRLEVCLRRTLHSPKCTSRYLFSTSSIRLDRGRHKLLLNAQTISLSPKEFEVLQLLMRHVGETISYDRILSEVWGWKQIGHIRLVKQYIYQLRQKIEPNPSTPLYIHTVRGEGYCFSGSSYLDNAFGATAAP